MERRRHINRKMKLIMVRDTFEGVERIGCRATGIHRGRYIERTAWAPFESANLILSGELRRLAEGRYNREVRIIDGLIAAAS